MFRVLCVDVKIKYLSKMCRVDVIQTQTHWRFFCGLSVKAIASEYQVICVLQAWTSSILPIVYNWKFGASWEQCGHNGATSHQHIHSHYTLQLHYLMAGPGLVIKYFLLVCQIFFLAPAAPGFAARRAGGEFGGGLRRAAPRQCAGGAVRPQSPRDCHLDNTAAASWHSFLQRQQTPSYLQTSSR